MPQLKVHVPTYNAGAFPKEVETKDKPEFGEPYLPVVAREADGVRIVLGSHDYWDATKPDVQIERRPNGWAIFLHPIGGGDASGFVYLIDDGRSYVAQETGTTPAIEMLEYEKATALVDGLKPPDESARDDEDDDGEDERCELCENLLKFSGDDWDGLCPECADRVSEYMDENNVSDLDHDNVVDLFRRGNQGQPWREVVADLMRSYNEQVRETGHVNVEIRVTKDKNSGGRS